ncbi:MAG: S41 family peptidase [Armatimonadetes bacterium]|nr:S41 family peptidase [Armatimonadota bacterium]
MKNKFLLIILILLFFTNLTFASEDKNTLSFNSISNIISTIKYEYVEEVSQMKLVSGAVDGIKKYLIRNKLDADFLKKVDLNLTEKEQIDELFNQYNLVYAKYPALNQKELIYEIIREILKSLDDPHTIFFSPKEYKILTEQMSGGNFGGIGIYIELNRKNNYQLTAFEVIEGTPAYKAGIKSGDMIIKINGISTKSISIEKAQNLLRGPVDTEINITIKRPTLKTPFNLILRRAIIHVKTLKYKILEDNIGYINLKIFGENTNQEIEEALNFFEANKIKAYILDLRNNGGGYITSAVEVCSKFLPTDSLVVTVEGRHTSRSDYKSSPNFRAHLPAVILVNDFSASASEITAGALKELKSATIIGIKTFGKASVQNIFPLSDGSALKITTAHYFTPLGVNIHKKGIEPDIIIKMKPENIETKNDLQLLKAIDFLLKNLIPESKETSYSHGKEVKISSSYEKYKYLESFRKKNKKIILINQFLLNKEGFFSDKVELTTLEGKKTTLIFNLNNFFGKDKLK